MNDRASACDGKQTTYSWAQAERVARRMRRDRGSNASPYVCRFCGRVHVGTSLKTGRQQAAARRKRRLDSEWSEW